MFYFYEQDILIVFIRDKFVFVSVYLYTSSI